VGHHKRQRLGPKAGEQRACDKTKKSRTGKRGCIPPKKTTGHWSNTGRRGDAEGKAVSIRTKASVSVFELRKKKGPRP